MCAGARRGFFRSLLIRQWLPKNKNKPWRGGRRRCRGPRRVCGGTSDLRELPARRRAESGGAGEAGFARCGAHLSCFAAVPALTRERREAGDARSSQTNGLRARRCA